MKILYFSLVHPHLFYGILAWGNANPAVLNTTIKLQKRAIRIINNAGYNSHTDPLFKISGILKVRDLYQYQTLFMLDYNNNRLPAIGVFNMYLGYTPDGIILVNGYWITCLNFESERRVHIYI